MKPQNVKHQIDGIAALLLFSIFAVCILSVLLSGADAYRRLTQRDLASYDRRTCLQYLTARVRQADSRDSITVEDFEGAGALRLADGQGYFTWVYCHEGAMMELYSSGEDGLTPADGEPIMALQQLDFSLDQGLLTIETTDEQGRRDTLLLSLRGGEEAAS